MRFRSMLLIQTDDLDGYVLPQLLGALLWGVDQDLFKRHLVATAVGLTFISIELPSLTFLPVRLNPEARTSTESA